MYDFFFYCRDYIFPQDPPKRVHILAADSREAWRKFDAAYSPRRYLADRIEHNMHNTSAFLP